MQPVLGVIVISRAVKHVINAGVLKNVGRPEQHFVVHFFGGQGKRLFGPLRASQGGRRRVGEADFMFRIGWLDVRDAEHVPQAVGAAHNRVVVDIPVFALAGAGVVEVLEGPCRYGHQRSGCRGTSEHQKHAERQDFHRGLPTLNNETLHPEIRRYNPLMNKLILVCLALVTPTQFALAASAPWYRAAALLQKTIGASPCFQVGKPEQPPAGSRVHTIAIQACTDAAARGLAQVIKTDFGYVAINVLKPSGEKDSGPVDPSAEPTLDQLKESFDAAFTQNPYFVAFHPHGRMAEVTLEFKCEVVQLFTDNLADLHGMSNYVAADAFTQVLSMKYGKLRVAANSAVK